jgi:hypothetical protein
MVRCLLILHERAALPEILQQHFGGGAGGAIISEQRSSDGERNARLLWSTLAGSAGPQPTDDNLSSLSSPLSRSSQS